MVGVTTAGRKHLMPARYKPVDPAKRLRDLRKEFKAIQQDKLETPPGPERARELAAFVRRAHDQRQLNFVMHAAPLALEQDPDAPQVLVSAYTETADPEERLRAIAELGNLGRWIGNSELERIAEELSREQAPAWVAAAEGSERRRRLRDLGSIFDRAFADDVRDQVGED